MVTVIMISVEILCTYNKLTSAKLRNIGISKRIRFGRPLEITVTFTTFKRDL